MSIYHIAKDTEAFNFIKKCVELLEKLQKVPGVSEVPSYCGHLAFVHEVQAIRTKQEETLRNKAKGSKRSAVRFLSQ
jgi:hypothetical protein